MNEKDEKKVVKQELDKQELEEKELENPAGGWCFRNRHILDVIFCPKKKGRFV